MRNASFALALATAAALPAKADTGPAAGAGAGEANKGQIEFNNHCRTCHVVNEGDNRLGPSLHNIFGAKAGQVEGFGNYSGSLPSDMVWDEANLDKFIASPETVAPNTSMAPYSGIEDPETRKQIIEYLKAQSQGS